MAAAACLASCADAAEIPALMAAAKAEQAVVNGEDDRHEVYSFRGGTFARATQSSVALIPAGELRQVPSGFKANAATLGDAHPLCPGATWAFANQPAAAACSGVLIDDDLVLTAGHCFAAKRPCELDPEADPVACCLAAPASCAEVPCDAYGYVFDYNFSRPDQGSELSDLDLYGCKSLLVCEKRCLAGGLRRDFAVVQLDRKVDDRRRPTPIRTEPVIIGENVTVIGYPQGLPAKIDAGGKVSRSSRSGWYANTDTFEGNSGSPGFDADLNLVGILTAGQKDVKGEVEASKVPVVLQPGEKRYGTELFVHVEASLTALCGTAEGREHEVCARAPTLSGKAVLCSLQPGPHAPTWWLSAIGPTSWWLLLRRARRRRWRRSGESD